MSELQFRKHRHTDKDPLTKLAEGLSETISDIRSVVSGLIKTEKKQEVKVITPVTHVSTSYAYPEYEYLYASERNLITSPVELCIGNLRSLVNTSYLVDFDTFYSRIYSIIPDVMVNEMTSSMDSYWYQRNKLFDGDESYEEIMKKFMDMAADINNVP